MNEKSKNTEANQSPGIEGNDSQPVSGPLLGRSLFGGFLMGLANLVPGISGGTMLLAAGIYPSFIDSLSNVTRFRFRIRSLLILGCVGVAALAAVLLFAGALKTSVLQHRWIMYSLFIGLTLGGVPIVWRMTKGRGATLFAPAIIAFGLMIAMAFFDASSIENSSGSNFLLLFLAGLAGASAMILPGLSGAYLLLLMGQYVPILDAVDGFKEALKAKDLGVAFELGYSVLLPVGAGMVIGIAVVGNLFKWLLKNFRTQTLGVLLGLLIGSTVGLYPFQEGVPPEVGDIVKGKTVSAESIDEIEEKDWPVAYFTPNATQPWIAVGLVFVGIGITTGVSMLGSADGEEKHEGSDEPTS